MADYPNTSKDFQVQFVTEDDCVKYLLRIRWPDGLICPFCHAKADAWISERYKLKCSKCRKVHSVLSGTVFQGTHTPLLTWFRIMWHICLQKNGYSALSIQRSLGLSYPTAWLCLHKLRRAMVRNDQDRLSGEVEVDECYVGGACEGKRGRGADRKSIVLVAAERKLSEKTGRTIFGRIRLKCIPNVSSETLPKEIKALVEPGTTIHTDGWSGYNGIEEAGYPHVAHKQKTIKQTTPFSEEGNLTESSSLPLCHRAISLLKRWILGTLQGSVGKNHLQYYLNEFTFRFNRRTSKYRGMLFWRLIQMATTHQASSQKEIVNHKM